MRLIELIAVTSVAACLQVVAAGNVYTKRAEENVCCEAKWKVSDVQGGCCGVGWGLHCCDRASRLQTCCFDEKRVVLFAHRLQSQLYQGVVWMDAAIFAVTFILTIVMLTWCCQSVCSFCNRSSLRNRSGYGRPHKILWAHPTRYGAVYDGNQVRTGMGAAPSFPGGPQPHQSQINPYARFDYTPSYYQDPSKMSHHYYGHPQQM